MKDTGKSGFQPQQPLDERLQQHRSFKKAAAPASRHTGLCDLSSFEELSKASTRAMYQQVLHLQISPDDLVPPEEFISRQDTGSARESRQFGFFLERKILVPMYDYRCKQCGALIRCAS